MEGFFLCFAAQFLSRLHGHVGPLLFAVIRLVAQGDALFLEFLQPLPVDLNTAGAGLGNRVVLEYPAHVVEQPGHRQHRRGRTVFFQMVQEVLGILVVLFGGPGQPVNGLLLIIGNFLAGEVLMDKLHRSIETFRGVELTENANLTLGAWLDKWLEERMRFTVRESTLDGYRRLVKNYIKPHLGDKKIGSVTTADIQKMYNWLRENGRVNEHYEKGNALSVSSVRGIHMLLHQAMDAAVQERIIVKNPTEGTVIPKTNYAPKKILTEAQLQKFLDVVRQDAVWSDFFYTELTTGMRRGEICGLRWQDFDEKTGRLQIRRAVTGKKGGGVKVGETKTEKGIRTIQLPPSTVEILKARKKKSYSEWIFHNPTVPELLQHRQVRRSL